MKKLDGFKTTIPGCLALMTFIAPPVRAQQVIAFANTNPITINAPRFPGDDGGAVPLSATPYPSTINVSGFVAKDAIDKITVTLHELSHGTPDGIDILLVGPEGQNIVIFSDAGGGFFGAGGGRPDPGVTVAVTITLDDDSEELLPDEGPLVSGTFKPSNYEVSGDDDEDPDVFPEPVDEHDIPIGPAPEPSSATELSVFSGTHPNGDWQLYVVGDEVFDAGSIAKGWSLTIRARTQSAPFRRGDSNQDGVLNLTDAVVTLAALFQGGAQSVCADAADADDDGAVSLTDAVYTLHHLFRGGPTPPAPGQEACGVDPTEDGLACESFLPCRSGCPGGLKDCGGICVDTSWDSANCGGCGIVCPEATACSVGVCEGLCVGCEF